MKQINNSLFVCLFVAAIMNLHCKKEYSCENCNSNKSPVAIAGPDQIIYFPADSVLLDGSASVDPDGTISYWDWTKVSGPASYNMVSPFAAQNRVKSLDTGVYRFSLKVTDNKGHIDLDTVEIKVMPPTTQPNRPPVANAGPDQVITLPVNTVTLDGSASSDPDNNITGYSWTKISGPASYTFSNSGLVQTQVSNLVQGEYFFELKVTDAGGIFDRDTIHVTVDNPNVNQPPVANAGADQTIYLPASSVTIDGGASTDPENNITSYQWVKISGPSSFTMANANAVQTLVTNLVLGHYQFELKVTDAGGLFDKDTVEITVLPPLFSGSNVYIAGWGKNAGGKTIARIWHNGAVQDLSNGQYDAWAGSVFVSGTDVYVAGYEKNASGRSVAKLWRNGVAQNLSNGQYDAEAKSVFVAGADVYVAGWENVASNVDQARLWKNGTPYNLAGNGQVWARASSLFVSGADVYVAGARNDTAVIWKNGLVNHLSKVGEADMANAVFVSGNDVYAAGGNYYCCPGGTPALWKNSIVQNLQTTGNGDGEAFSVFVYGPDVYVTGWSHVNGATLWKNGVVQSLQSGGYGNTYGNAVFVSGTDVFVAGRWQSFTNNLELGLIWKNGTVYSIPGLYTANSVFVQ